MKARALIGLGAVMTGVCTATCVLTDDPRWVGATIGVGMGALALARAGRTIDRLLEPGDDDDSPIISPTGPGYPVPTDPTPGDFEELAAHFERLDAELRLPQSQPARRIMAAARRREHLTVGVAERRAWRDLREQLEEVQ